MSDIKDYIEDHKALEKHILYQLFTILRYVVFLKGFVLGMYLIVTGNNMATLVLGIIAIFVGILEMPFISHMLLKDIKYLMTKHKRIFIELSIFITFAILLIMIMLLALSL